MFLAKAQRRQAKTDLFFASLRICEEHAGRRPNSKVFFMVFARREGSARCDGWTQAWRQRHSDALHHAKRKINSTAPSEELFSLRCSSQRRKDAKLKLILFLCVFAPLRGTRRKAAALQSFLYGFCSPRRFNTTSSTDTSLASTALPRSTSRKTKNKLNST